MAWAASPIISALFDRWYGLHLIDTIGSTGFLKKSSRILSLQVIKIPKKSTLQYLKVDSYKCCNPIG